MINNLGTLLKTIRLKADGTNYAVTAGTTDLTSEKVDMAGYDGVRFICGFGTITSGAVTSTKVQTSSDDSSYNDLAGTGITVADDDDNQIVITEIVKPQERYLKHIIDRGTQNAVVDFLIVELYGSKKLPTSNDATVVSQEIHVSPAEGTA